MQSRRWNDSREQKLNPKTLCDDQCLINHLQAAVGQLLVAWCDDKSEVVGAEALESAKANCFHWADRIMLRILAGWVCNDVFPKTWQTGGPKHKQKQQAGVEGKWRTWGLAQ